MLYEYTHAEYGRMRAMLVNNKPYFLAIDCYRHFGLTNQSIRCDYLKHEMIPYGSKALGIHSPCGHVLLLTEKGICAFVRRHAKRAGAYTKWLHEIASMVRATGEPVQLEMDTTTGEAELLKKIVESPEFGIRLLTELQAERDRRTALEEQIKADTDKARFMDSIVGEFARWLNANYDKVSA